MNVMGIIFASDTALGELTDKRTTASLPFGGRYRQVDFTLSNMAAMGIRHIGIISRRNYQSLVNHVGAAEEWGLELGEGGLEFLTPYAMSASDSYRGKLEALYTAMDFLEYGPDDEYVILADSSILYNMDLSEVLSSHIASGKDITVVTKAGIANGSKQLDLALKLNEKGEIADMAVDYIAPEGYLASMDLFIMSKAWLRDKVRELIARNLFHMDRNLVLGLWQKGEATVNVFQFEGVALYNESVEEYFINSLALIHPAVRHDLFEGNHPVFTKVRDRVPSYYGENCETNNILAADGCSLEGHVENSVLFRQVTVKENAKVINSVIMNETVIGESAELNCVIMDKDVVVRPGAKLCGTPQNPIIVKRGEVV